MCKIILLTTLFLALTACGTTGPESAEPAALEEPQKPEIPAAGVPEPEPEEEIFDPGSITPEVFQATKADIQRLIEELNKIIQARNFNAWILYLGDEYMAKISSPDYLEQIRNSSERLKNSGIQLRTIRDYFFQVVVPSRANSRVDDIEFISQLRVKAYTLNAKGDRLRLYDLEDTGESWKIIN